MRYAELSGIRVFPMHAEALYYGCPFRKILWCVLHPRTACEFPPSRETSKSSRRIYSAWKCKTKSQVQTNTMPVLSKRFKLNGVAPRAKSKLWRHAQLALKLIPASKDSHEDRITWKLVHGTNHQWFCFDLNPIFAASCGRPWFVFVGQCAQLWPYPHFHCHHCPSHRCPNTSGQVAHMSMNVSWHSFCSPSPWPLELEVVLTYPNWVEVRCARSSSTKPLKACAFWTQQTPLNTFKQVIL